MSSSAGHLYLPPLAARIIIQTTLIIVHDVLRRHVPQTILQIVKVSVQRFFIDARFLYSVSGDIRDFGAL